MIKNMGFIDRTIRFIVGIVLVLIGALIGPWWIALIAIIPIATASIGFCPLYKPFGISSCSRKEKEQGCN